ncbi:MAG: DUF5979 domain-containing protein [Atopobiaceae bacterium]
MKNNLTTKQPRLSKVRNALLTLFSSIALVLTMLPTTAYATTYSATVTPTLDHASAGYVYYQDASGAASASISDVTGSFTISDFAKRQDYWDWSSHNGYLVFFVKPEDNYLLTGLGASGNGDIYSVDATDYGNLANYPGIRSLVAEAKAAGYVGFFGYSRSPSNASNVDATFEVHGVQPQFKLSATSNKTSGVKPGDALTFTLTATPAPSINGKTLTTESVQLKSVTINGQTFSNVTLTEQADGTYQGTVSYNATEEDCAHGSVSLSAEAAITYGYALGVKDTTGVSGTINTTSTITTTASATCKIADNYGVSYKFTGDVPNGVSAPTDSKRYYEGDTVIVKSVDKKTVTDGNYTYTFGGWTLNDQSVAEGSTVTVPTDGLVFYGNWTKTRNTGSLALSKTVTGGAANKDQDFTFVLSSSDSDINGVYNVSGGSDGETVTFTDGKATMTLRHGQTKTIERLPAGATVKVKETGLSGNAKTSTTASVNGEAATPIKDASSPATETSEVSADITSGGTVTIAITNNADLEPNTGISTNTTPMVALAGAAAVGGVALAAASMRKRNGERRER